MKDKLTKQQAAEYLGVSVRTLEKWLWQKTGPRSYKYLHRIYFDAKDLEAFRKSITEIRAS